MTKEELKALLEKHRLGTCSQEELSMINSFDSKLLNEPVPELDLVEERRLEQAYLRTLDDHRRIRGGFRSIGWPSLGIAASLLLLITSSIFFSGPIAERRHEISFGEGKIERMESVNNESAAQMVFTLPDSSKVTLEPGATIKYDAHFSGPRRDVLLDGVAFFEVKRDEKRPFSVYTGDVITRVLGTRFTVDASAPGDSVTVSVASGKVAVYQRNSFRVFKDEAVLLPNQKVVFNAQEKVMLKTLAKDPKPIIPEAEIEKIKFEHAPVSEVFGAFERIYGIDLVYDETAFSGCYMKTSISGGEMFKRLGIICDAIGATYKVEGTRVTIEGPGCF